MNQRQIIEVVSKSFGLYFIVQIFLNFKQVIFYASSIGFDKGDNSSLYYYFLLNCFDTVIYALGAYILILKSELVASKLLKKGEEKVVLALTKSDLVELVIIGIGTIAVASAIPEILTKLAQYLYFNEFGRSDMNSYWNDKTRKAEILYSVFKLAIGLLTITNGRHLANLLTRIDSKDETTSPK